MIHHEPWEGAYSPVATAVEGASSAGTGAVGRRLADILRLSFAGSSRSSLGGVSCAESPFPAGAPVNEH
jgi:hypothetical protein